MKTILILTFAILTASCSTQKLTTSKPQIYWVNSLKVSCTGVAPMKCLQVQKNKTIKKGKWQNFYSNIEGFKFETGYIYKLSVTEEKIDPAKVPADGSSIKYTLVEVLEKNPDERFAIHDIWVLEAIEGVLIPKPAENDKLQTPVLEINVTEMKVMGSDGCNRIAGAINFLDGEKLEFGNMAVTRMMCNNMEIADNFNKTLPTVRKFKKEGLNLILLNESGKEVLRLKKVD